MVTGWGKISEGGPVSSTLLKAHMPIKSDQECARVYGSAIGKPRTNLLPLSHASLQTSPLCSVPGGTTSTLARVIQEDLS